MSDIQRVIDGTSPVLEAWDMLPSKPVDDDFWNNTAPTLIGIIASNCLDENTLSMPDAVMLLNLCERRLRGLDVDDMIETINTRVRAAGTLVDRLNRITTRNGEQQ